MESQIIFWLEMIGTVAFAASGALVGMYCGMDAFGVCTLGCVTAVGGGIVRDTLLGELPSSLQHPVYIICAAATSLVMFTILFLRKRFLRGVWRQFYERLMLVMDSVGLGIFTAIGVRAGITAGYADNGFLLVFLGTLTGVGGGLLRDVLAQQPPYILVKHIYALASIAGGIAYIIIYPLLGELASITICTVSVVVIRLLAAHYRWSLPKLRLPKE